MLLRRPMVMSGGKVLAMNQPVMLHRGWTNHGQRIPVNQQHILTHVSVHQQLRFVWII